MVSPPTPAARLVAMSATGHRVALRHLDAILVLDALGTAPRVSHPVANLVDFGCVGDELWAVCGGALRRFSLTSGDEKSAEPVQAGDGRLVPARGERAASALWWGERRLLVREVEGAIEVHEIEATEGAVGTPLGGNQIVVAEPGALRVEEHGGRVISEATIPTRTLRAAVPILGDRAIALNARDGEAESVSVIRPKGDNVHDIRVPRVSRLAVAEARGIAVIATEGRELLAVDLRYGKPIGRTQAPMPVEDLALDSAGRYVALAGFRADNGELSVLHVSYTELFGAGAANLRNVAREMQPAAGAVSANGAGDSAAEDRASEPGGAPASQDTLQGALAVPETLRAAPAPERSAGLAAVPPVRELAGAAGAAKNPASPTDGPNARNAGGLSDSFAADDIPDLPPLALHPAQAHTAAGATASQSFAHLEAEIHVAAARAARAIAKAWHTGRLSSWSEGDHPFEREVFALLGASAGHAPKELADAEARLADAEARKVAIEAEAGAAGHTLPADVMVREFGLSPAARAILLAVAAPAMSGEVARLYGILANDEARAGCDIHLLELLFDATQDAGRHEIARELSAEAPLVQFGLIAVHATAHGQPIFHPLVADPVVLARLRGDALSGVGHGSPTRIRHADRELEALHLPGSLRRDLVVAISRAPEPGRPLRLVLKGRPGSGRHAVLSALAARAGKALAVIDAEKVAGKGAALAEALRVELRRAVLRGAIPCIDGLSAVAASGEDDAQACKEVIRAHPGPVLVRAPREFKPPLDPGFHDLEVPPMSESERLEYWRLALESRGLEARGAEMLASRFRIGAATIEAVIATVSRERATSPSAPEDATVALDRAARQHIDTRLSAVATRVDKLVRWDQVALPDDVIDSIREFVGRIRHRRTVYESWGFDAKMTTSRGLSALFYGPPGTGKSMVAGLIARELDLDLYRVDLARITSKWIGETEKNLAEIFDAAEDGQAIILFDEADSLFAKRTEVKSSVDRYANLEVNYLLQRLDSFEGIAILTTNQEGSLDTAFKRRLSLRLAFPFPDEDMRVKLWAAHIPPELPTAGQFDFDDLARRFPMSGGYIRNSALRAAFLAAQEDVALSQDHLVRAIHLEYREMGKLAAGGKME